MGSVCMSACLGSPSSPLLQLFSSSEEQRRSTSDAGGAAASISSVCLFADFFLQLLFWFSFFFSFLLFLPSLFWMCRFFAWLGTCEKKQRWRSEKNHFFNCLIAVAFAWCWCCCCLAAWLLHLITLFMAPAATIKLQFMCVSLWHPAPPHFP